jgi:hypothetical protein
MSPACDGCPCAGRCPGGVFCGWLASGDPVLRAHVAARCDPPRPPAIADVPRPSIAEVLAVRACPYRSAPRCGCAAPRCALRSARPVSHLDCLDCLRRFGP